MRCWQFSIRPPAMAKRTKRKPKRIKVHFRVRVHKKRRQPVSPATKHPEPKESISPQPIQRQPPEGLQAHAAHAPAKEAAQHTARKVPLPPPPPPRTTRKSAMHRLPLPPPPPPPPPQRPRSGRHGHCYPTAPWLFWLMGQGSTHRV